MLIRAIDRNSISMYFPRSSPNSSLILHHQIGAALLAMSRATKVLEEQKNLGPQWPQRFWDALGMLVVSWSSRCALCNWWFGNELLNLNSRTQRILDLVPWQNRLSYTTDIALLLRKYVRAQSQIWYRMSAHSQHTQCGGSSIMQHHTPRTTTSIRSISRIHNRQRYKLFILSTESRWI